MRSSASRLQVVALVAAASLGLHEARYLLTGGGGLEQHLGLSHAYFALLIPALGVLGALALALFVRRLALSCRGAGHLPAEVSTLAVWLTASSGLLAIFVGQEWLESLLSSGHGGALHAVLGHGGWSAVLLAHLLGALVALVLRGARALVAAVARRRRPSARPRPALTSRPRLPEVLAPRLFAARHVAPRGPPSVSLV